VKGFQKASVVEPRFGRCVLELVVRSAEDLLGLKGKSAKGSEVKRRRRMFPRSLSKFAYSTKTSKQIANANPLSFDRILFNPIPVGSSVSS